MYSHKKAMDYEVRLTRVSVLNMPIFNYRSTLLIHPEILWDQKGIPGRRVLVLFGRIDMAFEKAKDDTHL